LVSQISDYSDDFCQILGEIFDCMVLVGDRDKVVSSYGISKKLAIGSKFSLELLDIIDKKNCYKSCVAENTTIVPILEDDKNTYYCQVIFPIVIQGDVEGVVILLDCNEGRCFSNEHITTLRLVAKFISIQME